MTTPPILYLDFETTGTDPLNDRIVEACFQREGNAFTTRVNPGRPIPAEATAVHGITDGDVAGAPTFQQIAPVVQEMVEGAVLCGYNIRRFDTLLLDAELRRVGKSGLPRDGSGKIATAEVDLYQLWVRHEARTLAGAAARFAGVTMGDEAHSASADTYVLPHMLEGMCSAFALNPNDLNALARLSTPDGCVDRDGKFTRRDDGVVLFNFGQSKGQPVTENRGFLSWMLGKDFSEETKAYAREFLNAA